MKRTVLSFLFAAALGAQLGATECGQITRDPGFDLWCGSRLCVWKVVRGEVRRVPTWHVGDSGVELIGPDAAISQLTAVNSLDTSCIRFELVADVEATAEAFLDVDLEGDGTIDGHERIPTASWKPVSFLLAVAAPFDGVRFELTKRGAGRAVFAQIEARTAPRDQCAGLTPIDAGPRPNGASCFDGDDCASGLCTPAGVFTLPASAFGLVCAACELGPSATCAAGQVCGYVDPTSPVLAGYSDCVATGARVLGEQCAADAECGTGICEHSVCSACRDGEACRDGSCRPAWNPGGNIFDGVPGPTLCEPSRLLGRAGEPCGTSGDCQSAVCNGAPREQCSDGRPCSSPESCPVDDGLAPGDCIAVGVQGGSCQ